MTRLETDSIGLRDIPSDALFGVNGLRGAENSALGGEAVGDQARLVEALATIKKAAALANREIGVLAPDLAQAIVSACDEVLAARHHDQFIVNMLEGSGGTSINMNANEVIANSALQILGHAAGDYEVLHPTDHVSRGQSTDDVVPTAVKLAVHAACGPLVSALIGLADAFAGRRPSPRS